MSFPTMIPILTSLTRTANPSRHGRCALLRCQEGSTSGFGADGEYPICPKTAGGRQLDVVPRIWHTSTHEIAHPDRSGPPRHPHQSGWSEKQFLINRVWLEQGKKISVENAPTYFGRLDYEIVSDVDHGKINATVNMPARNPPEEVWLRLRHPKSAPIKSVMVDGKDWKEFDPTREVVQLHDMTKTVKVEASY